MSCRICLEEDSAHNFVHPCACKGDIGNVHSECLTRWIEESKHDACEICKVKYYKREVCAWNPKRVCNNLCTCKVRADASGLFRKFGGIVFAISCFGMLLMDIDNMVLSSCISTLVISIIVLIYAIQTQDNDIGLYNAALGWKIAFSIPYATCILIYYMQLEDECDIQCLSMHKICDSYCPAYFFYEQRTKYLTTMWIYDLSILGGLIIIRTLMICYIHMRSLNFQDAPPKDEAVPLLSEEEP